MRGVEQFAVWSVGHVDQSDVVVLAVEAAGGGLVDPFEPVRAHDGRVGQRVLHIIAIRHAALFLAAGLLQPRSHAAPRRAEMEFADQNGPIEQPAHLVDFLLIHLVGVVVQAVNVEYLGQADDLRRRAGTEAQSQAQVIGIVLADGG